MPRFLKAKPGQICEWKFRGQLDGELTDVACMRPAEFRVHATLHHTLLKPCCKEHFAEMALEAV